MWVEELTIENIKCFEKLTLKFAAKGKPYKWVTLLGENGVGKSTLLQAIGLLLAGPEGAKQLLTKPIGWVSDDTKVGKISTRIHKTQSDPGVFGQERKRATFGYTFFVTGSQKISVRGKEFSEPVIVENADKVLGWLRSNAFPPQGRGWFAAGFGAFRRLTRHHQIIVPTLQPPVRAAGFSSQFQENEPLSVFEQWFVYLDYRIAKNKDQTAVKQQQLAVSSINRVLPDGVKFDSVNADGRILFDVKGEKVPTLSLSDGYRSVLALAGDLIWRLLMAYPDSDDPLSEDGVVLIDEIDIHLHPAWQRNLPQRLRELFPNIQFIVSTHSPFIAAGAGEDALTYRLTWRNGEVSSSEVVKLAFMNVEKVLSSAAFELVSPFTPETQEKIDLYFTLKSKEYLNPQETAQLDLVLPVVREAMIEPVKESELEQKMDAYLKKKLLDDKG